MTNDFNNQLEVFAYPESHAQTRTYMEKYWLDNTGYLEKWESLQTSIFKCDKYFRDMIFNEGLDIIIVGGGLIFNQEDFELFANCIKEIGDEEFVIIQNVDENDPPKTFANDRGWITHPPLRFKYPANITWDELLDGGGVSDELFKTPYKEYLIFGNKGGWGKCAANDYKYPLDIIGFENKYASIFTSAFKISQEEREEIEKSIPVAYNMYI